MRNRVAMAALPVVLWSMCATADATAQASTQDITCQPPHAELSQPLADHLDAICQMLSTQLPQPMSEGMQMVLVVELMNPNLFRGHLEWTRSNSIVRGATVDVGLLDAPLSAASYRFLISSLLNAANFPDGDPDRR